MLKEMNPGETPYPKSLIPLFFYFIHHDFLFTEEGIQVITHQISPRWNPEFISPEVFISLPRANTR